MQEDGAHDCGEEAEDDPNAAEDEGAVADGEAAAVVESPVRHQYRRLRGIMGTGREDVTGRTLNRERRWVKPRHTLQLYLGT